MRLALCRRMENMAKFTYPAASVSGDDCTQALEYVFEFSNFIKHRTGREVIEMPPQPAG